MESKKINQLATELAPDLSDLTIIGDPTTGISKKITLSQMASLFTGTVEEYANLAAFPLVGVADTIYVAKDTNVIYRWDSTAYVVLSPNIIASLVFSDANGFDGTIALVGSVATLTITTALTTGSVPFIGASGALTQDNSNLFFDDTNNRLGIATASPTTPLDVFGSGIIGRLNATSTNNAFLGFASNGTNKWSAGNVQSDHRFRIFSEANSAELITILQTGEFGIGIANPTTKFHIDGAATALIANLDANVSIAKSVSYRSDNSARINLEVSGTESGSNVGADFFLRTFTDAGSLLETPFTIVRSTGVTTIKSLTLTNALAATSGGTGQSSYAIGDLLYASTTTALSKLADVATGNSLISGGVGVAPSWGKIVLTTHVSGILPVANGGTGSTTQNFVDLTTTQSIGGLKTLTGALSGTSATFSGNVGIGATLSAWISSAKVLQLNNTAALYAPTDESILSNNVFVDSGDNNKYITTNFASQYRQVSGQHIFYSAASGTAGNTISFGSPKLTIASTGAATFSSSVTTGNTLYINGDSNSIYQKALTANSALYWDMRTSADIRRAYIGFGGSSSSDFIFNLNENGAMDFATNNTFRMRITSGGKVIVNTTDSGVNALLYASASSSEPYPLGSKATTSSQGLVGFFDNANSLQGSISISGATVSYNSFMGSHYSQFKNNDKPEVYKGTILEAIDELCEWEGETNDRLAKVKISDTIESKNVYGIFLGWDNTDEFNDMYVAALGASYIRVNGSQTVQMGDLLQSNGDGTAKIQEDDIMRSGCWHHLG